MKKKASYSQEEEKNTKNDVGMSYYPINLFSLMVQISLAVIKVCIIKNWEKRIFF